MLHVVTVADWRFRREAGHLQVSLLASNPNARLTIYCDRKDTFAELAAERCELVEVPEMSVIGAKRSKFAAYRHAAQSGSFLYLDADAIVLEPLDELAHGEVLSGCDDDLSHCPFIVDKLHPWPNAPELHKDVYINSDIFYFPAGRKDLLEEMYQQSRNDEQWNRYTFPNCLYDNHFLCAFLNLKKEPINFLDPTQYGWQGFYFYDQIQVERRGDQLVNKNSGVVLKLILFAGIRQSYDLMLTWPPDIASLVLARILPKTGSADQALASYLAANSAALGATKDPHQLVILRQTIAELRHLTAGNGNSTRRSTSYFLDPESMRAFACAQPPSGVEWNGLECGGAYLEAEEYAAIRDMVRARKIRTAVETGAGETSILFADLGVDALSVESQPGPWLERARSRGCIVLEIPFDDSRAEFDDDGLRAGIAASGWKQADLLFIDSPVGTGRRANLLRQFSRLLQFRYVLYHDAIRDARNIFRDQQALGLEPVSFFASPRGLMLLQKPSHAIPPQPTPADVRIDPAQVSLAAEDNAARVFSPRAEFAIQLKLEYRGPETLSSRLPNPVYAAYHWRNAAGEFVVFDGIRTALPCDIESGDRCSFDVYAVTPEQPGRYELQISLVQEFVCWFHELNPACLVTIPVEIKVPE